MNATNDHSTMAPWRGMEPDAVVLGELEVRPALPEEMERVKAVLKQHA